MAVASDRYSARLQVGRWLKGPPLSAVVVVRNLIASLASDGLGGDDYVAPSWVVVTRKDNGRVIGKLAAGREPGAGEDEFAAVRRNLSTESPDEFLHRYQRKDE